MYTVIIPVYNTPSEYILECVRSLNTDKPILIIDDGSDMKSTIRTLSSLPYRVDRIEHGGLSKAMNYAVQTVKTPWIIKLDSDDIAHPELFDKLESKMSSDVDVIGCQIESFGSIVGLKTDHPELVTIEYARNNDDCWLMNHTGCAFKVEALKDVPYRENRQRLAEDYELWVNMLLAGKKLINLPDILVRWRATRTQRQAAQSREFNKDFIKYIRGKLCV